MENPYVIDFGGSIIEKARSPIEKRKIDSSFCTLFNENIKISNDCINHKKKPKIVKSKNVLHLVDIEDIEETSNKKTKYK